ncbi:hypothetical protein B0920_08160 [Massilia sp. KIM]|uniref:right-handed parallel beta-helix repeat-containing protein n=1 Tax=Massilia sp. KIM TaxID=1955422 RepID=UPI00098FE335|nr:right-handed parallel beta-helix repeat-containing protein [Massilia sp. KIM]OON63353.1 hypothetical protein B0920_08160 [Massilia sp. KIM]
MRRHPHAPRSSMPPPCAARLFPGRLLPVLSLAILFAALLSGCRLRDGGGEQLVVPELVRTHLYVAPNGSDSNPGTRAEPFRTLGRAAQVVSPGTTVHVAPGSYSGGLRTATNGTAEARIVFQSTERWGAKLVPPLDARQSAAWDNRGNYVDIIGFEIDGSQYQSGMKWLSGIYNGGSHNRIVDNRIHHVGTDVPCEAKGGAGIGIDSYYKGNDAEVVGNHVHDIGPAGCRYMHGIYVSTTASVRNNVIYRIAGAGIHMWHDASHVTVRGNTIAGSGTGIVVGAGDFYHRKKPNDDTHVSNNIVVDNVHGILEQGDTGENISFRNNLVHGNTKADWKLAPGRQHTGTVSAAPLFVDYAPVGTPDFRLSPGSPAIGQGLAAEPGARASGAAPALGGLGKVDIGALPYSEP